jgi:precorrin-6x reductase
MAKLINTYDIKEAADRFIDPSHPYNERLRDEILRLLKIQSEAIISLARTSNDIKSPTFADDIRRELDY